MGKGGYELVLTRNDVLAAIMSMILLGFLLISSLRHFSAGGARGRLQCTSQLKQIGIAFQMFQSDNNDRLPYQVAGSPAFRDKDNTWRHFLALSNDLPSASLLLCPRDTTRQPSQAQTFVPPPNDNRPSLQSNGNRAVSFFVNLEARPNFPRTILCGDRNLEVASLKRIGNVAVLSQNDAPSWSNDLHERCGNVLRADGSVEGWSDRDWHNLASQMPSAAFNRLLLPNDLK